MTSACKSVTLELSQPGKWRRWGWNTVANYLSADIFVTENNQLYKYTDVLKKGLHTTHINALTIIGSGLNFVLSAPGADLHIEYAVTPSLKYYFPGDIITYTLEYNNRSRNSMSAPIRIQDPCRITSPIHFIVRNALNFHYLLFPDDLKLLMAGVVYYTGYPNTAYEEHFPLYNRGNETQPISREKVALSNSGVPFHVGVSAKIHSTPRLYGQWKIKMKK